VTKMAINRIFHYTSLAKLEQIMKDQALKPMTEPFDSNYRRKMPQRIRKLVNHKTYLVGFLSPEDKGWKEEELLEYVIMHTTKEARIEVPVLEMQGAFVRDDSAWSPRKSREVFNADLWLARKNQSLSWRGFSMSSCGWQGYFQTTMPLEEYQPGQYKAPEVWLPQTTPANMIRVISQCKH
jgi:hypothetical protein